MNSFIPRDLGLTADLPMRVFKEGSRRPRRWSYLAFIAVITGLLVTIPVAAIQTLDLGRTDSSASAPENNAYEFRHHVLNQTLSAPLPTGTRFCFECSDLPFDIKEVEFGDFRDDDSFESTYYSGSGILLSAAGIGETVCLRECGGEVVSTIEYTGQSLVVFGGETTSLSYPGITIHEGVDKMIQDWREGDWTPEMGVIVEHSEDTEFSDARFVVMLFEPVYSPQIPEFDAPAIVCLIMTTALLVGWFREGRFRKLSLIGGQKP